MKVKKFEDLDIWIRSRNTVKEIYKVTVKERFSKDWGLKDQITRAAVSVMSNIASLHNECDKIKRMTTSFIFYLKGYKYNASN